MGRRPSVDDALESGKLVAPFEQRMNGFGAYYLVYPEQASRLPRISLFREWILAQTSQTETLSQIKDPERFLSNIR
jgi:LysR family glycine cleavage system transcriptional activator